MARAAHVLIVDDDASLRRELAQQLAQDESFTVAEAAGVEAVLADPQINDYAAFLIDIGLGSADGRDLCRALRTRGIKVPIIMLTGLDSDDDTVTGLDAGANDYVTKPFRLSVLIARLRAHLRAYELSDDVVFRFGPYEFRPSLKMLHSEDGRRRIPLTEKETAILKYLYRQGEAPVARAQLLDEVWGYNAAVTTHTLETHIYRLRQKIEPDPGNAQWLLTAEGGYRLVR